jgi:hypothetical protein
LKAISIISDFGIERFTEISAPLINQAKADRSFLFRFDSPKWFLSELYFYLKKKNEIPELPRERKLELWNEAGKDKLLYSSLCLIEII